MLSQVACLSSRTCPNPLEASTNSPTTSVVKSPSVLPPMEDTVLSPRCTDSSLSSRHHTVTPTCLMELAHLDVLTTVDQHSPRRMVVITVPLLCLTVDQLLTNPLLRCLVIPNDMVGAIIGKGGAKINEIRQLSGSVIKINEPTDNSNERLVTITGTQECNQMALYMLYSRLG
jgi:hypothetical protein